MVFSTISHSREEHKACASARQSCCSRSCCTKPQTSPPGLCNRLSMCSMRSSIVRGRNGLSDTRRIRPSSLSWLFAPALWCGTYHQRAHRAKQRERRGERIVLYCIVLFDFILISVIERVHTPLLCQETRERERMRAVVRWSFFSSLSLSSSCGHDAEDCVMR